MSGLWSNGDKQQMSEDEIDTYAKELAKTDDTLYKCNMCGEEFYLRPDENCCPNCNSTYYGRA